MVFITPVLLTVNIHIVFQFFEVLFNSVSSLFCYFHENIWLDTRLSIQTTPFWCCCDTKVLCKHQSATPTQKLLTPWCSCSTPILTVYVPVYLQEPIPSYTISNGCVPVDRVGGPVIVHGWHTHKTHQDVKSKVCLQLWNCK